MVFCRGLVVLGLALLSFGCAGFKNTQTWQAAVNRQAEQLGYRNWIIIAEASFPAYNRPGLRQVTAPVDVPEAVDYVLKVLEQT
jgi:hypothetical protein